MWKHRGLLILGAWLYASLTFAWSHTYACISSLATHATKYTLTQACCRAIATTRKSLCELGARVNERAVTRKACLYTDENKVSFLFYNLFFLRFIYRLWTFVLFNRIPRILPIDNDPKYLAIKVNCAYRRCYGGATKRETIQTFKRRCGVIGWDCGMHNAKRSSPKYRVSRK